MLYESRKIIEQVVLHQMAVLSVYGCLWHFAGMGFIQSNHSVIMYNNTMISFNMMEVARIEGIKRCAAHSCHPPKILPLLHLNPLCMQLPGICPVHFLFMRIYQDSSIKAYPRPAVSNPQVLLRLKCLHLPRE